MVEVFFLVQTSCRSLVRMDCLFFHFLCLRHYHKDQKVLPHGNDGVEEVEKNNYGTLTQCTPVLGTLYMALYRGK